MIMENISKRVKLYSLCDDRQSSPEWIDKGTGHLISTKTGNMRLLKVFSEDDDRVLLDIVIPSHTVFEKQQETLILCIDKNDNEFALSFEEKEDCEAVWEEIWCAKQKVKAMNSGNKLTVVEESDESEDDSPSISLNLPDVDTSHLKDINEMIRKFETSEQKKNLINAILKANYIDRLLDVFRESEVDNNFESLAVLCEIFKHIITLSNCPLFEELFEEVFKKERIFDVIGCFEYDKCVHAVKQHREFLRDNVQYKEVIPVSNPKLLDKIHQTYRIQYIQDVILPSINAMDESIFLSPFLYVNKVAIVDMIQRDEVILRDVFCLLNSKTTENMERKNVLLFLKELFSFAQNLQPTAREGFYKNLLELKIVEALDISLQVVAEDIKLAAIEVFNFIIEYSPSVVRKFMLEQANSSSENIPLITSLICGLVCEADNGQNSTYLSLFKLLLNPESMESSLTKSDKTEFLNYFYENAINIVIEPILSISGENYADKCFSVILELLEFCVEHHSYHMRNVILHKDLLRHVLKLMNSRNKILALSALRFIRKIIALKDEFYNKYIVNGDLLQPVVEAFVKNQGRYNMLDSAILEMFEFIRTEELKSLCSYVMENYGEILDNVKYVQTFKYLRDTYEQNCLRNKLKHFPIYLENYFKNVDNWYCDFNYKDPENMNENKLMSEKNDSSEDQIERVDMEIDKGELNAVGNLKDSPRPQSVIIDRTPIYRKMGRILRPGRLSSSSESMNSCRKRLMNYEFDEDDDENNDKKEDVCVQEVEEAFGNSKRIRLD